jgi:ABC-type multidrug transport system ATPase subunit
VQLSLKALKIKFESQKIIDDFTATFQSPLWVHFKIKDQTVARRLLATLASFYRPFEGEILWEKGSIYYWLDEYRANIRFFEANRDLFDYFTVQQSLELYSEYFDLSGTADIDIYGDLDRQQKIHDLTREEEVRLKLSTFLPEDRSLLFFANPFSSGNIKKRTELVKCFKKICQKNTLIFTAGVNNLVEADRVIETVPVSTGGEE